MSLLLVEPATVLLAAGTIWRCSAILQVCYCESLDFKWLHNGLQAVTPESEAVANIKNNTLVQQLIRPVLIGG